MSEPASVVEAEMLNGNWKPVQIFVQPESARQWVADRSFGRVQINYRIRLYRPEE